VAVVEVAVGRINVLRKSAGELPLVVAVAVAAVPPPTLGEESIRYGSGESERSPTSSMRRIPSYLRVKKSMVRSEDCTTRTMSRRVFRGPSWTRRGQTWQTV